MRLQTRWIALVAILMPLLAGAQRLPGTITPQHYDLTFTPDLQKATFNGEETIEAQVAARGTSVVLNAAELEIQRENARKGGAAVSGLTDASTESHWESLRAGVKTVLRHPQGFGLGNAGSTASRTDVDVRAAHDVDRAGRHELDRAAPRASVRCRGASALRAPDERDVLGRSVGLSSRGVARSIGASLPADAAV